MTDFLKTNETYSLIFDSINKIEETTIEALIPIAKEIFAISYVDLFLIYESNDFIEYLQFGDIKTSDNYNNILNHIRDVYEKSKIEKKTNVEVLKNNYFTKEILVCIPIQFQEVFDIHLETICYFIFKVKKIDPSIITIMSSLGAMIQNRLTTINYNKRHQQNIEYTEKLLHSNFNDLNEIYNFYLNGLFSLLNCKFISLWLYNNTNDTIFLRSFYPNDVDLDSIKITDFDSTIIHLSSNLIGNLNDFNEISTFQDLVNNEEFINKRLISKLGINWMLVFPIIDNEGNKAYIFLFPNFKIEELSQYNLDGIKIYINQYSGIMNLMARFNEKSLLKDYERILEAMLNFSDDKTAWDKISLLVSEIVNCEACSIFIKNKSLLELKGTTGIVGFNSYKELTYDIKEDSLTTFAFNFGKPYIYYSDSTERPYNHKSKIREITENNEKTRSLLLFPIFEKDEKIGLIRCNNKKIDKINNIDKFVLEDLNKAEKVSFIISILYGKIKQFKQREIDKDNSLNSLHHELMAPLKTIKDQVEWLEIKVNSKQITLSDELLRKFKLKVDDIRKSLTLTDVLTASFQSIDNILNFEKEIVSLRDLINSCSSAIYKDAIDKSIKLDIDFIPTKYEGDSILLFRLFYNLFINAIRYFDYKENSKYIKVYSRQDDKNIFIYFEDNGIGIEIGEENRIFERSIRGKNAANCFPSGTGLGLSYCKSILKAHGGEIKFVSLKKPTIIEVNFKLKI